MKDPRGDRHSKASGGASSGGGSRSGPQPPDDENRFVASYLTNDEPFEFASKEELEARLAEKVDRIELAEALEMVESLFLSYSSVDVALANGDIDAARAEIAQSLSPERRLTHLIRELASKPSTRDSDVD